MSDRIFLLHSMGHQSPDWAAETIAFLKDFATVYGDLQGECFEQLL